MACDHKDKLPLPALSWEARILNEYSTTPPNPLRSQVPLGFLPCPIISLSNYKPFIHPSPIDISIPSKRTVTWASNLVQHKSEFNSNFSSSESIEILPSASLEIESFQPEDLEFTELAQKYIIQEKKQQEKRQRSLSMLWQQEPTDEPHEKETREPLVSPHVYYFNPITIKKYSFSFRRPNFWKLWLSGKRRLLRRDHPRKHSN